MITLLRHFPEEIEADILRYYPGQDVAHWWQGVLSYVGDEEAEMEAPRLRLSSRRLALMIEHLPEDSATWKARRDDRWTEATHLLAYIGDQVHFMRADAQAIGGAESPMKPERLPRPGDEETTEDAREVSKSLHDYLMRNQEKPEAT